MVTEVVLSPGLAELAKQIADTSLQIEIPDPEFVDLGPMKLASLVARSSNAYGRCARLAGMARAEAKLAKGRYDRKYKASRKGSNDTERDAVGMEAAADEHSVWVQAEAVATVAESVEAAARIASESARKLLGQQESMLMATGRERRGAYQDSDFASW
jgi:hypothetical protein